MAVRARDQMDLASTLSTLTAAVQRTSERIVRLESGLGVNVDEEYSQLHQQSAQLMEVASAVERLTDAVTKSDQQHKREIKELWSVIRRMQGHPIVEVEDPRDEMHMRVLMLERRFGEFDKTWKDTSSSNEKTFNDKLETLKSTVERKFVIAKENQDQCLARKANFSDMEMLLSDKADQSYVTGALLSKADVSELHKVSSRDVIGREDARILVKGEIQQVGEKLKDYEQQVREMRVEIEALKANVSRGSLASPSSHGPSFRDNTSTHGDNLSTHSENYIDDHRRRGTSTEEEWVRRLCAEEAGRVLSEYKKYGESAMEAIATSVVRRWESDPDSIHHLKLKDTRTDILDECTKALQRVKQDISIEVDELRERGDQSVLKLVEALNAKAFKGDVARALKTKVDVEGLDELIEDVFSESSLCGEKMFNWMVARMKEQGYLMNSAIVTLLERKADSSEVSGALSRTAHSVDGLLDDLSGFKSEIRKQFDSLASKLNDENNNALSYKQEAKEDLSQLMRQLSKEECEKNALQAVEETVKRMVPRLVSEAARQEVRHVARGLVQQVAQEEVPEEVRQALEKSLQIQQMQCELNLLIERIVRVESSTGEMKENHERDSDYRLKSEEVIRKELKAKLKSELSVDLSEEVQRMGEEITSRNEAKLSDLVKQVALAAESRVSSAAGAAASSAARATIDQTSMDRASAIKSNSSPNSNTVQNSSLPPQLIPKQLSGRWLWRSGHLEDSHWVPWEVEALNSSPQDLIWTAQTTSIIAKVPGLYRLSFGFFTHATVTIEVCLNGEPILTRCPFGAVDKYASSTSHSSARVAHEAIYQVIRNRHSVGDVTSAGVDEYVALPAGAALSIRMESSARAQGFLALKKL